MDLLAMHIGQNPTSPANPLGGDLLPAVSNILAVGPARWKRDGGNIARIIPSASRRKIDGVVAGQKGPPDQHLLIIDPTAITRGCLVAAVADAVGKVTAVPEISEALDHVAAGILFDTVLVNLTENALGDGALLRLIAAIRASMRDAAIMVLTPSRDPAHILAALHQGIRGYLTIDMPIDLMIGAINFVAAGWVIHPPLDMKPMPQAPAEGMLALPSARLTPRQQEVLNCLATGMPNKAIAFRLGLSERTVKAHVHEIMQRVGVVNRTQIVALLNEGRNLPGA